MTVSNRLERFKYFNSSTTILQLNNNSLHQIFVNLYDHESNANALLIYLCEFPVDHKRGWKQSHKVVQFKN